MSKYQVKLWIQRDLSLADYPASSRTAAAPYFRIFNPVRQGEGLIQMASTVAGGNPDDR